MGQIRVVFSLPEDEAQVPSERLAYVKWFSKFTHPESDHGMHKLTRSMVQGGDRLASIIPISSIWRSVHLLGFCLYPINPGRFSNQYRTGADRCTLTLPR